MLDGVTVRVWLATAVDVVVAVDALIVAVMLGVAVADKVDEGVRFASGLIRVELV